jgi:hypothetical protein
MHLTNNPGLWQHFVNRPDNVGRPIMEVKQKYLTEINAFESSVNAMSAGDSGAGGGTAPIPSSVPQVTPSAPAPSVTPSAPAPTATAPAPTATAPAPTPTPTPTS